LPGEKGSCDRGGQDKGEVSKRGNSFCKKACSTGGEGSLGREGRRLEARTTQGKGGKKEVSATFLRRRDKLFPHITNTRSSRENIKKKGRIEIGGGPLPFPSKKGHISGVRERENPAGVAAKRMNKWTVARGKGVFVTDDAPKITFPQPKEKKKVTAFARGGNEGGRDSAGGGGGSGC